MKYTMDEIKMAYENKIKGEQNEFTRRVNELQGYLDKIETARKRMCEIIETAEFMIANTDFFKENPPQTDPFQKCPLWADSVKHDVGLYEMGAGDFGIASIGGGACGNISVRFDMVDNEPLYYSENGHLCYSIEDLARYDKRYNKAKSRAVDFINDLPRFVRLFDDTVEAYVERYMNPNEKEAEI